MKLISQQIFSPVCVVAHLGKIAVALMVFFTGPLSAATDFYSLSLKELANISVVTGSRLSEKMADSASHISILTRRDIRYSGARTIYDLLQQLPGISVSHNNLYETKLMMRGIVTNSSDKILWMLNGHILNEARTGGATFLHLDNLPIDNIARIEVVRGAASAVYGANAFLGMINVITEDGSDGGTDISFSVDAATHGVVSQRFNLKAGVDNGDSRMAVNINIAKGDGHQLKSGEDRFGRVGQSDSDLEQLDIQFQGQWKDFSLQARYGLQDHGGYYGFTNVLSEGNSLQREFAFIEGIYRWSLSATTEWELKGYVDYSDFDNYYMLFPPGTITAGPLSAWNGSGYIGSPQAKLQTVGFESNLDAQWLEEHRLLLGMSAKKEKQYDIIHEANFNPGFLPQVQDVSASYNFSQPASRDIVGLYIEDQWAVGEAMSARAALRYDRYSDFGATINPQIGLSWRASDSLTLRAQYAEAFHAPTFFNQFNTNNPVIEGNPDLEAETIHSTEIGAVLKTRGFGQWTATLYRNHLDDLVTRVPNTTKQIDNLQEAETLGADLEAAYRFGGGHSLAFNYSYADTEVDDDGDFPFVPSHSAGFVADLQMTEAVVWRSHWYWQSGTQREANDSRREMAGYSLLNSTLSYSANRWPIMASLSVYNLFDRDYFSPSPSVNAYPNDYPEPGRSWNLQVEYHLE